MTHPKHGSFERRPTRYTERPQEAWVYLGPPTNQWAPFDYAEIAQSATPLTRAAFEARFGTALPSLPTTAFR